MQYKMIVSDFDGTLLRSDNVVSKTTVDAIARYRAAGGVFTVSTGRSLQSILNRLPETGLSGSMPVMALQGGYAADLETGKELFRAPMTYAAFLRFAEACRRRGLYFQGYTPTEILTDTHTEQSTAYEQASGTTVRPVGDVTAYLNGHDDIIKALAVCEKDTIDDVCREMCVMMPDMQVFTSSPIYIECVSPKAGKGNGIVRAAQSLGLSIEQVAAVGDQMNDYTMVRAAGLGVAVRNAVPALQAAADMVVASNDEDGICELIDYCLTH